MADVAVVVVTYDALPWIEQCLESVRGIPTVVVDNGSSDGTPAFVRERFPEVEVVEAENRGLAAGWNRGVEATDSRYVLILNADAWLVGDSLARLVDERRLAAARGHRRPRACRTPTGRCSARSAASRRRGASRPSTSACASLRRARRR